MERLSIEELIEHCDRQMNRLPSGSKFYQEHESVRAYLQILRHYIATSLTPERVAELAQAEKDGRLVVLPCDIGAKLWYIHNGGIYQATVHEISISPSGETALVFGGWPAKAVWGCNIGKTVFLTLEEAEKALREEAENG